MVMVVFAQRLEKVKLAAAVGSVDQSSPPLLRLELNVWVWAVVLFLQTQDFERSRADRREPAKSQDSSFS
jgi:hypothetical protein